MNTLRSKYQYIWQNAENLLIILFLATFTLNVHKVFLTPYSFLNGTFNEYMTPNFNWADLIMFAVIIVYAIKFLLRQFKKSLSKSKNNILDNSIYYKSMIGQCFHIVSRETIVLVLFLFWIGLSLFWSQYKSLALFRFATFLEISLFFVIAIKHLKNKRWFELALIALIINGLFQSILGIAQFIHNKSLGLHWLGESIIGPNIDGVAKIIISGEKHIRAYGTFPHPNILAGLLIIPIFIILTGFLNKFSLEEAQNKEVSRGTFFGTIPTWITSFLLFTMLLGFFLTFSRSAFLGLIIGLFLLSIWHRNTILKKLRSFLILLMLLTLFTSEYFIFSNKFSLPIFSTQSLEERNLYKNVARETISKNSFAGVGIGQFIFEEFQKHPSWEGWQYQPVHNVYLLIFSELGIIGLVLFLLLIAIIFERWSRDELSPKLDLTVVAFCCILSSFLFISLFDHYFWDIKIGMAVFMLPILFLKIKKL